MVCLQKCVAPLLNFRNQDLLETSNMYHLFSELLYPWGQKKKEREIADLGPWIAGETLNDFFLNLKDGKMIFLFLI